MNRIYKYIPRDALQTFSLALGYGICFYLLNLFLHQRGMAATLPDNKNLLHWDAGWYREIVDLGYLFKKGPSNTGFYVLFPWIWKLTHLSPIGMAFLNIVFFAAGMAFFVRAIPLTTIDKLILLSTPPVFYAFIPYSEPVFVLLGSIAFWGISRKHHKVVFISLFLLAMSRPVVVNLIPAFILTELIVNDRRDWLSSLKNASIRYLFPLVAGTAVFIFYQYYETGVWFAYFIQQRENWGHKFSWPTLPFGNMNGPMWFWLNALTLFVGFVSTLILCRKAWNWLVKNEYVPDRLTVLSWFYMGGMLLVTILFNPLWGTNTTNVYDAQRYMLVSPFFWAFFARMKQEKYGLTTMILMILLANAFWLLFGSYLHVMTLVYFNFCTAFVLLYMAYSNRQESWPAFVIVAVNVLLQVHIFQQYLGENMSYPG